MDYPLTEVDEVKNTKDRILLAAAILFAERGYAAVSVRDIAECVNIKPASLYNHFEGKEALFDAIVDTIKQVYLDFYDRVEKKIEKADNFEQMLDCLFAELIEVYHIFIFYGVALITTEQFRNEKARHAFNDVYMKIGIDYSTKIFDGCIEKKWVKPFDTRALATFFMNNILAGSLVRVQQDLKVDMAYDPKEMFVALRAHMLGFVERL